MPAKDDAVVSLTPDPLLFLHHFLGLYLVLSWYTIVLTAANIVLAPIVLDDSFTPAEVVIGSFLALPVLIYAILVLVHLRKPTVDAAKEPS